MTYSHRARTCSVAIALLTALALAATVSWAQSSGSFGGSTGGFGGAGGIGGTRGFGNIGPTRIGPQTGTVIVNPAGGFTVYSPGGHRGQFLGPVQGSGRVYHSDGSVSTVIEDGRGNANIYGPHGPLKAFGSSPVREGGGP